MQSLSTGAIIQRLTRNMRTQLQSSCKEAILKTSTSEYGRSTTHERTRRASMTWMAVWTEHSLWKKMGRLLRRALIKLPAATTTPDSYGRNMGIFTVGAAGVGVPLQWVSLGPSIPAAPTDDTVGAAGNLSRPYSWGWSVGAAQSLAAPVVPICRGQLPPAAPAVRL
jgi:hypothetical protein